MKKINKIVMAIAGVLFIVGSVLKAHQLLTEPIISKGFWESWLFFVIQIPLELGLGIWLLCGLFRKAAWLISLISFGFFHFSDITQMVNRSCIVWLFWKSSC